MLQVKKFILSDSRVGPKLSGLGSFSRRLNYNIVTDVKNIWIREYSSIFYFVRFVFSVLRKTVYGFVTTFARSI